MGFLSLSFLVFFSCHHNPFYPSHAPHHTTTPNSNLHSLNRLSFQFFSAEHPQHGFYFCPSYTRITVGRFCTAEINWSVWERFKRWKSIKEAGIFPGICRVKRCCRNKACQEITWKHTKTTTFIQPFKTCECFCLESIINEATTKTSCTYHVNWPALAALTSCLQQAQTLSRSTVQHQLEAVCAECEYSKSICTVLGVSEIHSFQSRDWPEDLECKTSIKL